MASRQQYDDPASQPLFGESHPQDRMCNLVVASLTGIIVAVTIVSAFVFPKWPPKGVNIFFAVVMLFIGGSHLMLVTDRKCTFYYQSRGMFEFTVFGQPLLTDLCQASRRKALANSVDPDEMPHDAASHQGLRCLPKDISIYWYRQGDLDPKFRRLIFYNAFTMIMLCVVGNLYLHNVNT